MTPPFPPNLIYISFVPNGIEGQVLHRALECTMQDLTLVFRFNTFVKHALRTYRNGRDQHLSLMVRLYHYPNNFAEIKRSSIHPDR